MEGNGKINQDCLIYMDIPIKFNRTSWVQDGLPKDFILFLNSNFISTHLLKMNFFIGSRIK